MASKISPSTVLLLSVPPLMWAGNAVVGRMMAPLVPPITLNLLRWLLAALILLPFGWRAFRSDSGLRKAWRPLALMGLVGIGCYNAFQYLALKTSTPLNITLVAASMPIWMMLVGAVFFREYPAARQIVAALFSIAGVLVVLSHGDAQQLLALRLVPGDLFMLAAALCWAVYSWLLMRAVFPESLRNDWAAFLLAQVVFGIVWSGLAATFEWQVSAQHLELGWPLVLGLLFIAVGPAVIAYRCWGIGVQRAGPTIAAFFTNLTPLLTALFSAWLLGEVPQLYHAVAFVLIVLGIVLSARR
ncbi:DMT family transporter [Lampropedia puyangensis]|uniref:DMT family transporter n=1 Tax=Lampropedia puyangensis TaxID=1330072 RepID=A0A4S8FBH6_9BURK|nr:DMT family transporter [Lampropedia puyangensis]THU04559.1 DMT family transporter [Lampropedia puyangensis]